MNRAALVRCVYLGYKRFGEMDFDRPASQIIKTIKDTRFPPHACVESALYYARLLKEDGALPSNMSLEDLIRGSTPRHRIYNYVTGLFDRQDAPRPCFFCTNKLTPCECQRSG